MDAIISYIINNSSAGLIIIITVIIVWYASKLYHKVKSIDNEIKVIKHRLDTLPCEQHAIINEKLKNVEKTMDKHENRMDKHEDKISNLDVLTASMCENLNQIAKILNNRQIEETDILATKTSPLTITPTGKIVLEKCFGKKIIDNNLDFFIDLINEKKPKTKYDIETAALIVLLNKQDNEIFNELKDFIYESPETIKIQKPDTNDIANVSITMFSLLKLMSIYLRDKYFEYQEKEAVNEVVEEKN